ncbi:uncharacterized protein LOC105841951 isoform X2 [Bombyx mori]|uniref:N-acetyllactosaminide beta-1,3-N-acetylglucosaminyltransferase n=1 Tax=Bombyx mori TaxID=7091 RepID=A0A8R2QYL3_BOMMO|nr:uncharacterized protein LOC105841951 isoform X2 [Bombyx mori]
MTRCLRIFGAYSYRLSRRHSTILLLAFLIATVTLILHLYAYRHQEPEQLQTSIGDFDYKPASFLIGMQPNESINYCDFNYGLPHTLEWDILQTYPSPETGNKSPYRVIYDAIKSRAYSNCGVYNAVTYATQATPEFIYHIVEIARYWDGPISLSVFVPDYDLDITMQIMNQLCHCYPGMSKVSLHLFYPKKLTPKLRTRRLFLPVTTEPSTTPSNISLEEMFRKKLENYRNLNNKTRAEYIQGARKRKIEKMMIGMIKGKPVIPKLTFKDCSGPDSFDIKTFRKENNMLYPINVGRNVARNASKTNYFIVSDIEMVPSDGLATKFLVMLRKLMGNKKRDEGCVFTKTIFVVPLFEVERGEEIPRNKDTLVRMVAANRAMYFHQKVCSHCQRFPGLQSWLLRTPPDVLEPMLIARREYPYHRWEPLYFGTHKEPWYSEMLSWEGRQDKMPQMLELCLQEYRMVVLDGGFLCHAAVSRTHSTRQSRAERLNSERYMKILAALRRKYHQKQQCKVM